MKTYKTYEELKTECTAKMDAFITITNITAGMLSEEGRLYFDVYDYLNDFFALSTTAAEFIEIAAGEYRELVKHYDMLTDYEKRNTWNNPKVHRLIRKYVKHNFPIELRLTYPEFLSAKEN